MSSVSVHVCVLSPRCVLVVGHLLLQHQEVCPCQPRRALLFQKAHLRDLQKSGMINLHPAEFIRINKPSTYISNTFNRLESDEICSLNEQVQLCGVAAFTAGILAQLSEQHGLVVSYVQENSLLGQCKFAGCGISK